MFRGRRLLLFYDLNDQTDDTNQHEAKLKQFSVCNHATTPSLAEGAEVPSEEGQTAYRMYGNAGPSDEDGPIISQRKEAVNFPLLLAKEPILCYDKRNKET